MSVSEFPESYHQLRDHLLRHRDNDPPKRIAVPRPRPEAESLLAAFYVRKDRTLYARKMIAVIWVWAALATVITAAALRAGIWPGFHPGLVPVAAVLVNGITTAIGVLWWFRVPQLRKLKR